MISSCKQVIDTYYSRTSDDNIIEVINKINKTLSSFDKAINAVFIFEFFIKVISLGFFLDEGSYLTDSWNKLDFLIVVFSIVDMSINEQKIGFIKV